MGPTRDLLILSLWYSAEGSELLCQLRKGCAVKTGSVCHLHRNASSVLMTLEICHLQLLLAKTNACVDFKVA